MFSAGMFSALAARIAVRSRGLPAGSPPPFAAIVISLIRRVKTLPRLASVAPFLCLIVAHFECPDMMLPSKSEFANWLLGQAGFGRQTQPLASPRNARF